MIATRCKMEYDKPSEKPPKPKSKTLRSEPSRREQLLAEMAAMPISMADRLPSKEEYTLDFCMWLQANFDKLKDS